MYLLVLLMGVAVQPPPARNYPYRELEGVVEEFQFQRNWRSYYWREDFTLRLRDDAGKVHRVISREPTPWGGKYRLGTTFTGLEVDWKTKPRVKVIGVQAIDRSPAEFYDLKLDPDATVTALIVRVETPGKQWRDYFVNNWFHRWGPETDRKILPHYAREDGPYTVYGFLNGTIVPLDAEGKKLLEKYPDASIYHARIVPAKNEVGYERRLIHLLGRDRKTLAYVPLYGDPATLVPLDIKASPRGLK